MKKYFIIFIILIFITPPAFTRDNKYSVNHALLTQHYLTSHRRNVAILHNILNLTDEQIILTSEMMNKYDKEYDLTSTEILKEAKTLEILKKNNAPCSEINNHKSIIKNYQNYINKLSRNEEHDFIKILNKHQRKKYRLIEHLERHDFKKDLHCKKYMKTPMNF